jgi:hypothetical protein
MRPITLVRAGSQILAAVAIMASAVIYGTDVFCAIVQRPAPLARSNRLRGSHQQARLDLLVEQLTGPAGAQPAD